MKWQYFVRALLIIIIFVIGYYAGVGDKEVRSCDQLDEFCPEELVHLCSLIDETPCYYNDESGCVCESGSIERIRR